MEFIQRSFVAPGVIDLEPVDEENVLGNDATIHWRIHLDHIIPFHQETLVEASLEEIIAPIGPKSVPDRVIVYVDLCVMLRDAAVTPEQAAQGGADRLRSDLV